jgi:hypothetical protein
MAAPNKSPPIRETGDAVGLRVGNFAEAEELEQRPFQIRQHQV